MEKIHYSTKEKHDMLSCVIGLDEKDVRMVLDIVDTLPFINLKELAYAITRMSKGKQQ